jgi:phospholipase/carboxylesterase
MTQTLPGPIVMPASRRDPQQLVILIHGYGSNGDDLIGLVPHWQSALPDTVFVAPNAPSPCPGTPGGYQWWPLNTLSMEEHAAGARQAAPVLDGFIDEQLARFGLTEQQLALVGFSQGTMMALHVGPRRERQIAGIVGYSGMLVDPDGLAGSLRSRPPVLLIHGDADDVLPIAALHQAKTTLDRLGFDLTTHMSHGLGHSVDEVGLTLGRQFLCKVLAGPK